MKHFKSFVLWGLVLLVAACESHEEQPLPEFNDSNYFPLMKGQFFLYDVEETKYTLSQPQTFQYELKVSVIDSFINGSGNYTYVLSRKKRTGLEAWQPIETWSAEKTAEQAIVTEGSTRFVVLRFPLKVKGQWNGNAYNNLKNPVSGENQDFFEVSSYDEEQVVNGTTYPQCTKIIQEDNQEYIVYNDNRFEVYARGVGLVFKSVTQLKYCNDPDLGCSGMQIIDNGIVYTQTLKEYGKE